jgi:arylsulfatase
MTVQSSVTHSKRWAGTHLNRRGVLLTGAIFIALSMLGARLVQAGPQEQQPAASQPSGSKPNIVVIFGDDIGQTNVSAYTFGLMGYKTPNIDRIAKEGMMFTDYYAEQSCTAGRSSFITGQATLRTGLSGAQHPSCRVCRDHWSWVYLLAENTPTQ